MQFPLLPLPHLHDPEDTLKKIEATSHPELTPPSPPSFKIPELLNFAHEFLGNIADSPSRSISTMPPSSDLDANIDDYMRDVDVRDEIDEDDLEEPIFQCLMRKTRSAKYDTIPPCDSSDHASVEPLSTPDSSGRFRRSLRVQHSLDAIPANAASETPCPRSSARLRKLESERQANHRKRRHASPEAEGDSTLEHEPMLSVETPLKDDNEPEDHFAFDRPLRKRTARQQNPYKYDKHFHVLQKKTGCNANEKKVEKMLKEEIGSTQRPVKKSRTSRSNPVRERVDTLEKERKTGRGKAQRGKVDGGRQAQITPTESEVESVPGSINVAPVFDESRVHLNVYLDGQRESLGVTPIVLATCPDNNALMQAIDEEWSWQYGDRIFAFAQAIISWEVEMKIPLRPGGNRTFDAMVEKIKRAPVWAKGDDVMCEVDVLIHLK
jgi:hypothetical protein